LYCTETRKKNNALTHCALVEVVASNNEHCEFSQDILIDLSLDIVHSSVSLVIPADNT
jgi:hypothetical protein